MFDHLKRKSPHGSFKQETYHTADIPSYLLPFGSINTATTTTTTTTTAANNNVYYYVVSLLLAYMYYYLLLLLLQSASATFRLRQQDGTQAVPQPTPLGVLGWSPQHSNSNDNDNDDTNDNTYFKKKN